MHACRLLEALPEVAHASHTNLPRRGEQWRQSADVTAFLQKGHVHFADSVRFHCRFKQRVSEIGSLTWLSSAKPQQAKPSQQEHI